MVKTASKGGKANAPNQRRKHKKHKTRDETFKKGWRLKTGERAGLTLRKHLGKLKNSAVVSSWQANARRKAKDGEQMTEGEKDWYAKKKAWDREYQAARRT